MLRLFVSASIFVIALGLAGLPARAQSSSDATSKSLRVAQNVSPTQVLEGLHEEIGGLYRVTGWN